MLSRLENNLLGNETGLQTLEAALTRCTDTLLRRKNKNRLIIDLDFTEDPASAGEGFGTQIFLLSRPGD